KAERDLNRLLGGLAAVPLVLGQVHLAEKERTGADDIDPVVDGGIHVFDDMADFHSGLFGLQHGESSRELAFIVKGAGKRLVADYARTLYRDIPWSGSGDLSQTPVLLQQRPAAPQRVLITFNLAALAALSPGPLPSRCIPQTRPDK